MANKKKTRIILIGRSEAGKTTLSQRLYQQELKYHKTQTIQCVNDCIIDTPGEYLERRKYHGALMVAATDADIIVLAQEAGEKETMFPPAYASAFSKPIIGVVTKCDMVGKEEIENAKKHLCLAGVGKIFETSSTSGEGIESLVEYLNYRGCIYG